jgi:uncharacterized protein YukE
MGLFDGMVNAIEGAVSSVEHTAGNVIQGIENDVSSLFSGLFPGSSGNGAQAHQIYEYFYAGPGTKGYHGAAQGLANVIPTMQGYNDHLTKAQQALSSGWQGGVADQAQQSFTPLTQNAQALTTHADGMHTQLANQADSFDTTKPKVVQVSPNAPSGPGLSDYASLLSPVTLFSGATNIASADAAISSYQQATQANQAAYTAYQGPTNSQTAALPGNANLAPVTGPGTPTPGPVGTGPVGVGFGSQGPSGTSNRNSYNRYSGQYGNTGSAGNTAPSSTMPGVNQTNPWNPGQGSTNTSGYPGPGGNNTLNNPNTPGGGGGNNPYGGSGFGGPGMGGAGYAAGGFGGAGGYGGSRFGAGSSSATGGGGRSGVGGLGSEEAGAGRSGLSGAAGARGSSGMPGSGGAGKRGKGQDDAEHKTAAYLQEDDPDSIFGTDQKTVPPVIGL